MRPSETPLIAPGAIRDRTAALAAAISRDYAGRELTALVVLKGAMYFAADLTRMMTVPVELEFVRASSYRGMQSSGTVTLRRVTDPDLRDRHVLIIEDIVDTGRTTAALLEQLRSDGAASVAMCTLLDKPSRRVVPVVPDYIGFTVDDHFVVGYGLDLDDHHRALPGVHVLEPDGGEAPPSGG
jgi:hypoxanthine phosphoribosyltransferase